MYRENDVPGVHLLLSLIEPDDAVAVRRRLGIDAAELPREDRARRLLEYEHPPRSVHLWMLERDDTATNQFLFHRTDLPDAVKLDIQEGRPFGTAQGPLVALPNCGPHCDAHVARFPASPDGVIAGLRRAQTMDSARWVARLVRRDDWAEVAEADRAEPLSDVVRWALSQRIDCPPGVRAQFGPDPEFAGRLRAAGIVEPPEFLEFGRPPDEVLAVLYYGLVLFPHRVVDVVARLAPLVRAELRASPDAWAVLAQLLPTFAGTVPELVRTCGAIAHA